MEKLRIGIDQDNTITNFSFQFIKYAQMLGHTIDMSIVHSSWHIENSLVGLSKNQQNEVLNEILFIDDFWLTMKPMPYAVEMLEWLDYRYNIFIVTIPWRFTDKFKNTKLEWIENNLPYMSPDQVIFSDKKWELNLDIIIDDKSDTLLKCKDVGMVTIAYDWPYNRNVEVDIHMKSWHNIPHYIKEIKRKFAV